MTKMMLLVVCFARSEADQLMMADIYQGPAVDHASCARPTLVARELHFHRGGGYPQLFFERAGGVPPWNFSIGASSRASLQFFGERVYARICAYLSSSYVENMGNP